VGLNLKKNGRSILPAPNNLRKSNTAYFRNSESTLSEIRQLRITTQTVVLVLTNSEASSGRLLQKMYAWREQSYDFSP